MSLPLMIHSALALFVQRTRIPTSARSIGFCVIWVCISSSSFRITIGVMAMANVDLHKEGKGVLFVIDCNLQLVFAINRHALLGENSPEKCLVDLGRDTRTSMQ